MNELEIGALITEIKVGMFGWPGARGAPFFALAKAIEHVGDGDHVEIGSLFGGSAILAAKMKQILNIKGDVYCVDPMVFEEHEPFIVRDEDRPKTDELLLRNQVDVFQDNLRRFGVEDRVHLVRAKSFPWPFDKEKTFASMFIDGWHYGTGPTFDVITASNCVTKSILLDDVIMEYPEVYSAFRLLVNHGEWFLHAKDPRLAWFITWPDDIVPHEDRIGRVSYE